MHCLAVLSRNIQAPMITKTLGLIYPDYYDRVLIDAWIIG